MVQIFLANVCKQEGLISLVLVFNATIRTLKRFYVYIILQNIKKTCKGFIKNISYNNNQFLE